MHSGFRIPGIQHQHKPSAENSSAPSMLLSMNQTRHEDDDNLLEQIHSGAIPSTAHHHQLFMNNHGLFPPAPHPHHHHHHPSRVNHHYVGPTTAPSAFFPLSFKLVLSEYCSRNDNIHDQERCCTSSYDNNNHQVRVRTGSINEGHGDDDGDDDAALVLLRGSEQYEAVPETRHTSLGMLHCWQNQEDSAIKQPPFWEAEASNENSEIVDRIDNSEMNNKHAQAQAKSRVHFGELEAIYKRLGSTTAESDQTGPINEPVNNITHSLPHPHQGLFDHGSENSIGEHHHQQQQESASFEKSTRKRKKKKKKTTHDVMIDPMTEFFGNLVKQVMEHQENLHKKFSEAVERLDEERRRREEAWRSQELAHFEREAAERARERDLAESREAAVISYLEKITGEKINLPPKFDPNS